MRRKRIADMEKEITKEFSLYLIPMPAAVDNNMMPFQWMMGL